MVLSVKAKHLPGPKHPGGQVKGTQGGDGLRLGLCIKPYSRILCAAFCTVTSAVFFPSVLTDIVQRNAEFMLTDLTVIIIIIIIIVNKVV